MLCLKTHAAGITFKVRVQPRAKKNAVVGLLGDALRIKLTAPPVNGAANTMCLKYLASLLDVPVSALEIISGKTGREKTIRLAVLKQEDIAPVIARLKALMASV